MRDDDPAEPPTPWFIRAARDLARDGAAAGVVQDPPPSERPFGSVPTRRERILDALLPDLVSPTASWIATDDVLPMRRPVADTIEPVLIVNDDVLTMRRPLADTVELAGAATATEVSSALGRLLATSSASSAPRRRTATIALVAFVIAAGSVALIGRYTAHPKAPIAPAEIAYGPAQPLPAQLRSKRVDTLTASRLTASRSREPRAAPAVQTTAPSAAVRTTAATMEVQPKPRSTAAVPPAEVPEPPRPSEFTATTTVAAAPVADLSSPPPAVDRSPVPTVDRAMNAEPAVADAVRASQEPERMIAEMPTRRSALPKCKGFQVYRPNTACRIDGPP